MIIHAKPATHPLRQLARQWKLGILLYYLYYVPKGIVTLLTRKGILNLVVDARAQRQMEAATYQLPTMQVQPSPALEIHFLTGKKFWYQTCFCAYSMAQQTSDTLCPVVYDDGSLEPALQSEIQRIFPNATIVSQAEIDDRINTHLPQHRFPYLRERRENYPNLKKLTDVHVGSTGWKLVLDSDMLFFHPPVFLLAWLRNPQQPCYMIDVGNFYGYPLDFMESLAGAPIAERINVGICGLNSETIDWDKLEYWCKTMIENQGTHYCQEQALVAMLMAGQSCAIAPSQDYKILPDREEVIHPEAVLHHYVSDSKSWYFRYGWKRIKRPM